MIYYIKLEFKIWYTGAGFNNRNLIYCNFSHIQEHLKEKGFKTGQSSEDVQAIKNGDDTKGWGYYFHYNNYKFFTDS